MLKWTILPEKLLLNTLEQLFPRREAEDARFPRRYRPNHVQQG